MSHVPAPRPRRRRWPWVLLGVFVLLIVFGADLAWAGVRTVDRFRQSRDELVNGGNLLVAGDLVGARAAFVDAESDATSANAALNQPALRLVGALPWFADQRDAADRGATAATLAAQGGQAFVDAAQAAGWDGSSVPGFSPGGHVDAAAIEAAAPAIQRASDLLGQAESELTPIDTDTLMTTAASLVTQARDEIKLRAAQASTAAELAKLLPPMLGADEPRTYLLVTLSPSDPRASGGYPGVYGLLHVDGERLMLSDLAPTSDIPGTPPVSGPKEAKKIWGWTGIDRFFWDTTYTPDFPTAAIFMKGIWEVNGGEQVDGVITGDPALMASLLQVVGPVDSPAWPVTITADNVEAIVGADVYRTTSQARSDAWEVGIGTALWDDVLSRPWPMIPMATAMSGATAGGHLQVWSANAQEEQVLATLDATGAFQIADNRPLVKLNGFSANRAGYFATTDLSVESSTADQPRPLTTVEVTVNNAAPTGPPSILLGIHRSDVAGKSVGTFATDVNVYLPKGAAVTSFRVNGRDEVPFEWNELGAHGVGWPSVIEPGKTVAIEITYRTQ